MLRRTCMFLAFVIVTLFLSAQSRDEGQPAPRFNARTITGEHFSNQSVRGNVVLLEFWTSWCRYCHDEEPYVDQLDQEFASQGLITLAVNVGEDKSTVKKYLQKYPRTVRVVLTGDTNLAAMYQATSYPVYVLIDREGNIAAVQRGAGGERALRRMLSRAGL